MPELFLPAGDARSSAPYRPYLLGEAQLHYVATKPALDHWEKIALAAPLTEPWPVDLWESAQNVAPERGYETASPAGATFLSPPAAGRSAKPLATLTRGLTQHLYQSRPLTLMRVAALGGVSAPGESEGAFRGRLGQRRREARDEALAKVRARYGPRIARFKHRLAQAEGRTARESAQYESQKVQTAISLGATLAGALFGRKLGSTRNLGRATTAARGVERAAREREERARAEERREDLSAELATLESELQAELAGITAGPDPATVPLEPFAIRPRKTDIVIGRLAILWVQGDAL